MADLLGLSADIVVPDCPRSVSARGALSCSIAASPSSIACSTSQQGEHCAVRPRPTSTARRGQVGKPLDATLKRLTPSNSSPRSAKSIIRFLTVGLA